ncbi:MAG: pantetheine-phosphate adenylyltransferase [Treponemataceae bacterium]|nr:pantetheine-phosphate adenylyltransferase [Treponemataceae bacterium]
MTTAVFPGSFDPPTYGHLNIIERASRLFDNVDVVIAVNAEKKSLFTADERIGLMKVLTDPFANVSVHQWEGLIVNYAKQNGANILLRGIRNANDFAYEFDLSLMNHNLNGAIETLFIPTEQRYSIVKSSAIKELAFFGGDISGMVPPVVAAAMKQKYEQKQP